MVKSATDHSSFNKKYYISKGEMIMKTNKGFSMVELIIVIAIMAILAGALAPSLIKYINKSRLSTDIQTGQTIATAIQTALSNETAYDSASSVACIDAAVLVNDSGDAFQKEVASAMGKTQPKAKSKKDVNGVKFKNQSFWVHLDPTGNVVEVYCGTSAATGASSWMVYPSVGAGMESK